MNSRPWAIKTAILAALAAGVLLAATACANPVAAALNGGNWGLEGSWGNSSYTALPTVTQPGLLLLRADGTFQASEPNGSSAFSGTYALDTITLSGSARTYQIKFITPMPSPSTTWVLARVSNGTTYESVSGVLGYPFSISTGDGTYGILTSK